MLLLVMIFWNATVAVGFIQYTNTYYGVSSYSIYADGWIPCIPLKTVSHKYHYK